MKKAKPGKTSRKRQGKREGKGHLRAIRVADYLDSEEAIANIFRCSRDENPAYCSRRLVTWPRRAHGGVAKASGLAGKPLQDASTGCQAAFRNDCHHHAGAECRFFSRKQVAVRAKKARKLTAA